MVPSASWKGDLGEHQVYRFGTCELDLVRCELRREGQRVHVAPRPFALLVHLITHPGRVISKDELLEQVWQGAAVSDEAFAYALHAARRAVGDDGSRQRVVETVPRRGLRFAARLDAEASPDDTSSGSRDHAPFVGRDELLTELRSVLASTRHGVGSTVLLAGEPGVGKTRTAETVAAEAERTSLRAVFGRCVEVDGAPAFHPWVQALGALVDALGEIPAEDLGPGAPELAKLLPRLGLHPESSTSDPKAARFLLFDAVARLVRIASAEVPLLLVLDDLHRADLPSLVLLAHLARELADAPVAILGTHREAELHAEIRRAELLADVAREAHGRSVALRGLTRVEVASLTKALTGREPSARVTEDLHAQTNGNPLFVTQVLQVLRGEGRLTDVQVEAPLRFALPLGVRDAIARQTLALPRGSRDLLALAAVVGRDFDLATLSRAAGRPPAALVELLDRAVEARVVREDPRSAGHYRFEHLLVRDVLYAGLGTRRRAAAHERVGDAIVAISGGDAGDHLPSIAHHYGEAARIGDVGRAIEWAERAGNWALEHMASEEAVSAFERALSLHDQSGPGDASRRCSLLLSLGEARTDAGDRKGAREVFSEAARLARQSGLPEQLARAALRFAPDFLAIETGVYDAGLVSLLEEAVEALGGLDRPVTARLLARLAVALHWEPGSEKRRTRLCREALEMALRLGDEATERYVRCAAKLALYSTAEPERYLELEAGGPASEDAEPIALLEQLLRMTALLILGRVGEFDLEISRFETLAGRHRKPQSLWYVDLFRATRAVLDGRFEDARIHRESFHDQAERVQDQNGIHSLQLHVFVPAIDQGGFELLEQPVRDIVQRFPALVAWRAALALQLADSGKRDAARHELDRVLTHDLAALPKRNEWSGAMAAIALAAAATEHTEAARRIYPLLLPHSDQLLVFGYSSFCWGSASLPLGVAATTLGEWLHAERHFCDALEANERVGARPSVARTRYHFARMLLRRGRTGDRERALSHIGAGLRLASELGLQRLQKKLEALTGV